MLNAVHKNWVRDVYTKCWKMNRWLTTADTSSVNYDVRWNIKNDMLSKGTKFEPHEKMHDIKLFYLLELLPPVTSHFPYMYWKNQGSVEAILYGIYCNICDANSCTWFIDVTLKKRNNQPAISWQLIGSSYMFSIIIINHYCC